MFGGNVGKENQHVKCRRRCRVKGGQECGGLWLAALMGEMIDHTQMTGHSHRLPDPGITESTEVVRWQVLLFFFMQVQSASICACVTCKPCMTSWLTAAAC